MKDSIHIVAFDNPFPPDYGGAMDVFYKIKALQETGVRIHLHFFEYGRKKTDALHKLADRFYVYPRKYNPLHLFSGQPYIVKSRAHELLLKRLQKVRDPVLFEGIHTTAFLPQMETEKKWIRVHNVEWEYYGELARWEEHFFKKWFFKSESRKLKRYEPGIWKKADMLFYIHPQEKTFLPEETPKRWIPPFHPYEEIKYAPLRKNYVLFHGNLSVAENRWAVREIWENLLKDMNMQFVIAGKNPGNQLKEWVKKHKKIHLIANPTHHELEKLVMEAGLNLIYSPQFTGFKLKLLHALYRSSHVLVQKNLITRTPLEGIVAHFTDWEEARDKTAIFLQNNNLSKQRKATEEVLHAYFDNKMNAKKIMEYAQ